MESSSRVSVTLLGAAWRAMQQNRLRTGLTMLGMIIGVGAVVVMLGVGQGARTTVNESIKAMGSNLFIVLSDASTSGGLRMEAGTAPTLTVEDALVLTKLDSIKAAALVFPGTEQLSYSANNWSTLVYAVTPDYLIVRDGLVISGQGFTDADVRGSTRVVVLGQTMVDNLFGVEDPIRKTIRFCGSPDQVIGGIGIMNIMLVSVTERTREIGIFMARLASFFCSRLWRGRKIR